MGDRNRQSTEDCQGSEAALYETILMGCYSCCLINKLCLTPCNLMDYGPPSSSVPGKNAGAGSHFLLQGIFPTLGSNLCLLHWQADSLPLHYLGSPKECIKCVIPCIECDHEDGEEEGRMD